MLILRRLVSISILALALAACGTTPSGRTAARPSPGSAASATTSAPSATRSTQSVTSAAATSASPLPSAYTAAVPAGAQARRPRPSRIDQVVGTAKAIYANEVSGPKLHEELARIARDRVLLEALSRGDRAGAQAEANTQLRSPANHLAHVTRISVTRGSQVLVNATVNADGVFVVAPASRPLRLHGRPLGTLLVSIQDVTGFVKLVHRRTGAAVLVRGSSGRVRTSLPAVSRLHLPPSGHVTVAMHTYRLRSFAENGWGGEPLTIWILESA